MTSEKECYKSPLQNEISDILDKSGATIMLYGEVGTSKTFTGRTMSDALFVSSLELKPNFYEKFTQNYRKCIEAEIYEIYEVIEGEVVEITDSLVLKTMDMVSSFKVGDKMMSRMKRDGMSVGDFVRINNTTGKFRIVEGGRIQTGELRKRVEEAENVNLYCMDLLNSKINPFDDCDASIDLEIRNEVDKNVLKMVKDGKANLKYKKLIIDDAQVLSEDELIFIQSFSSPVVQVPVLIISDKNLNFDGLKIKSKKYESSEIKTILESHAGDYEIEFVEDAFEKMVEIAGKMSLKYAISLIPLFKKGDGSIQLKTVENFMELFKSCC